jgi:hypothetical protein
MALISALEYVLVSWWLSGSIIFLDKEHAKNVSHIFVLMSTWTWVHAKAPTVHSPEEAWWTSYLLHDLWFLSFEHNNLSLFLHARFFLFEYNNLCTLKNIMRMVQDIRCYFQIFEATLEFLIKINRRVIIAISEQDGILAIMERFIEHWTSQFHLFFLGDIIIHYYIVRWINPYWLDFCGIL